MSNFCYECKRFKNGAISIRFSPDEIKEIDGNFDRAFAVMVEKLWHVDMELMSEYYECLGNSGWYVRFLSYNNDCMYMVTSVDYNDLMAGKAVRLYPNKKENE